MSPVSDQGILRSLMHHRWLVLTQSPQHFACCRGCSAMHWEANSYSHTKGATVWNQPHLLIWVSFSYPEWHDPALNVLLFFPQVCACWLPHICPSLFLWRPFPGLPGAPGGKEHGIWEEGNPGSVGCPSGHTTAREQPEWVWEAKESGGESKEAIIPTWHFAQIDVVLVLFQVIQNYPVIHTWCITVCFLWLSSTIEVDVLHP